MRKSYAKEFKKGPVFRMVKQPAFGNVWELEGKGNGIGKDWEVIGMFMQRKYAVMMMRAIAQKAKGCSRLLTI